MFDGGANNNHTYLFIYDGLVPPFMRVVQATPTTLSLSINHTNPNVTTFKLQIRFAGTNSSFTTIVDLLTSFDYTITGLNSSTGYEIKVFASLNNNFEYVGYSVIGTTLLPLATTGGTRKKRKEKNRKEKKRNE